jgi:hypothetical protein
VSKATATLELDLPPEQALAACRAAIARIDWELVEGGGVELHGRQDPARLCCTSAPVSVEIALTEAGERTTVALRGKVPGFGPVARRDLRSALSLLATAIGRTSVDPGPFRA